MVTTLASDADILAQIDLFCSKHGLKPSTFGRLSIGDANLITNLKADRSLTLKTARRIVDFMASYTLDQKQAAYVRRPARPHRLPREGRRRRLAVGLQGPVRRRRSPERGHRNPHRDPSPDGSFSRDGRRHGARRNRLTCCNTRRLTMTALNSAAPVESGSVNGFLRPAPNASCVYKIGDHERAALDWYVEPRWCVEQLI
jgi:hypothetical protein